MNNRKKILKGLDLLECYDLQEITDALIVRDLTLHYQFETEDKKLRKALRRVIKFYSVPGDETFGQLD